MSETKEVEIESSVLLRAIGYRVQLADEWTVIFTENAPVGGRPTKFMFHRDRHSIWRFQFVDAWGDSVPASHVTAAHEWCKSRLGDDFAQHRLPIKSSTPEAK